MANSSIAAIVPVYNEAAVLNAVIKSLTQKVSTVILVDDGSCTPVLDQLEGLPVTVLRHRVNLGQGASLQTGFMYARQLQPDIIITFDADGQHRAEDIDVLIAPLLDNSADIVLGSRFLPDSIPEMSLKRKLLIQCARYANLLLTGVILSDAHNGLRAFNANALAKIDLTENRMAHASEILFEIKRHRLRYKEVPVHIKYTDYSQKKGQRGRDGIKVFFDIVLHKLFR